MVESLSFFICFLAAIICPALVTGAFADRVLFPAYLVFIRSLSHSPVSSTRPSLSHGCNAKGMAADRHWPPTCSLFVILVYCPFAHWLWNPQVRRRGGAEEEVREGRRGRDHHRHPARHGHDRKGISASEREAAGGEKLDRERIVASSLHGMGTGEEESLVCIVPVVGKGNEGARGKRNCLRGWGIGGMIW
jgi:hypothetical protein